MHVLCISTYMHPSADSPTLTHLHIIKIFQAEKNCDCELDKVGMHDNTPTNYHKNGNSLELE